MNKVENFYILLVYLFLCRFCCSSVECQIVIITHKCSPLHCRPRITENVWKIYEVEAH
jgi:hypothetical protein